MPALAKKNAKFLKILTSMFILKMQDKLFKIWKTTIMMQYF